MNGTARGRRELRGGAYADPALGVAPHSRKALPRKRKGLNALPAPALSALTELLPVLDADGLQIPRDLASRERRTLDTFMLPIATASDACISPTGKLVYALLFTYDSPRRDGSRRAPYCGAEHIAGMLGLRRNTVTKAIAEIIAGGLIARRRTRGRGFIYEILRYERQIGLGGIGLHHGVIPGKKCAVLFIPRYLAARRELSPRQKLILSALQYRAGNGNGIRQWNGNGERQYWGRYLPEDLVGLLGVTVRKPGAPMFPTPRAAAAAVQRDVGVLVRYGLVRLFGPSGARKAALIRAPIWEDEWAERKAEKAADAERKISARGAEATLTNLSNGPNEFEHKYLPKVNNSVMGGGVEQPGCYTLQAQSLGQIAAARKARTARERARRKAARDSDPLQMRLAGLIAGAVSGAGDASNLSREQVSELRERVLDRATREAKAHGLDSRGQGKAGRAALDLLQSALDRELISALRSRHAP